MAMINKEPYITPEMIEKWNAGGEGDYSLSETDTGRKWIDGKKIYRKTYSVGTLPNTTTKTIATLSGVDNVIKAEGFAMEPSTSTQGYQFRPLPFASGGSNDVRIAVDQYVLQIQTYADWGNQYVAYITIFYTKN